MDLAGTLVNQTGVASAAALDSKEASTITTKDSSSDKGVSGWHVFGRSIPKQTLCYFAQVLIIYAVVIASLVNLTVYKDENKVWIALLSSCIGYMLPQPQLKAAFKQHSLLPN